MAELYEMQPLFPGDHEIDQIQRHVIFLGPPQYSRWPHGYEILTEYFDFDMNAKGVLHDIVPPPPGFPSNLSSGVGPRLIPPSGSDSFAFIHSNLNMIPRLSRSMQGRALDLFKKLVDIHPIGRLSAAIALEHSYFATPTTPSAVRTASPQFTAHYDHQYVGPAVVQPTPRRTTGAIPGRADDGIEAFFT
jgi:serine/threonine protein kinase